MRRVMPAVLIVLLWSLVAVPVLAAPASGRVLPCGRVLPVQEGGGVRFGPYTLESGGRNSGDLVVFGGPVVLRSASVFSGDLTVFGRATIEEGAELDGQIIVLGDADIAGVVDGDVFTVDGIVLRATARIRGDVTVVGNVDQRPGAVIEGELRSASREEAMRWSPLFPRADGGIPVPSTAPRTTLGARLAAFVWRVVRGLASVVVMGLLALVIASLWPDQMERVGRVIEEAPLVSFGVGLLTLLIAGIAATLLAITICLSPFAVVGLVVVGVGLLLGWVGLGIVLGRRVLSGVFNQTAVTPVVAAVTGTVILALLLAVSRFFGPLYGLFLVLIFPPAAGAVLLTRFGSRPYATRQGVVTARPVRQGTADVPPSGESAARRKVSPRPAPLPGDDGDLTEGGRSG